MPRLMLCQLCVTLRARINTCVNARVTIIALRLIYTQKNSFAAVKQRIHILIGSLDSEQERVCVRVPEYGIYSGLGICLFLETMNTGFVSNVFDQ